MGIVIELPFSGSKYDKEKPLKKGILIILDQFVGKLHRSNIKRMDFFLRR